MEDTVDIGTCTVMLKFIQSYDNIRLFNAFRTLKVFLVILKLHPLFQRQRSQLNSTTPFATTDIWH